MKRILSFLLCFLLLTGCGRTAGEDRDDPQKLHIVTTIFPAYDFARSVVGDLAEVTLLLPPGTESHSYEPTPADILKVQDCDLFFYLGGETDNWVDTILTAAEPGGRTMRMVDCVPLLEEADLNGVDHRGHDHEHEEQDHDHEHTGLGAVTGMDEHVWTSPKNAAEIVRKIGEEIASLDAENAETYLANAEDYAARIDALDAEFEALFESLDDKTIVFGDRFPLLYFAERYELDYYAAFPGCSTQTEPSAATIAFLTDKVREEKIPTVWYIEFSNHLVADSIAEAAGVRTALFHTCHNVSRSEINGGATYLSLMTTNLETMKMYMRQ